MVKLEPHEEQIITEQKELEEKIDKLITFMNENYKSLNDEDKKLLTHQLDYMISYNTILKLRIQNFINGKGK